VGPGEQRLVIDIDSFVGEVHGDQKQGASDRYTKQLGYHPLLATRAGTGEVLHIPNRKGKANTQRGNPRFVDELIARVQRAGATGTILIRADSGFENHKLFKTFDARRVEFSIGVKQRKPIRALIEQISEDAWVRLTDYPKTGEAQIAETQLADPHNHVADLVDPRLEQLRAWRDAPFAEGRARINTHAASSGRNRCSSAARGSAPTTRSISCPSRIMTSSGIDCAPNLVASPGFASTSTFTTLRSPA
jgi:hypothetical protein